jgi:hypothetical protein
MKPPRKARIPSLNGPENQTMFALSLPLKVPLLYQARSSIVKPFSAFVLARLGVPWLDGALRRGRLDDCGGISSAWVSSVLGYRHFQPQSGRHITA